MRTSLHLLPLALIAWLIAADPAGARAAGAAPSASPVPTATATRARAIAAATPPAAEDPNPAAAAANLDFDLLGASAATVPPAALEVGAVTRSAQRRRTLLKWHQGLGLGMLAAMAVTAVLGQLNYRDLYGGGSRSGSYLWPHRAGVGLTTLAFAGAGTLALLAPQPYEKSHTRLDSALVHKISAAAATAGMLAQLVLGFVTARQADAGNDQHLKTRAQLHQALGYATLGFVGIAAVAYVF